MLLTLVVVNGDMANEATLLNKITLGDAVDGTLGEH